MNHNIIYIVIAWSLLAFVGYNVLSAEAVEKYDYDSYEEYTEIIEPICKEHGGKIEWGSGECMFKTDSRKKAIIFEKELDDRGLGGDYTAEEEASWNQEKTGFLREDYDWDEFYDDEIRRESVEEVCGASEDYKKHKEACDKAYYKIEKQEEASREAYPYIIDKSPLPPTKEYKENVIDKLTEEQKEQKKETIEEYKKEVCENLGAEWKNGRCDTKGDDKKADKFLAETRDIRED